MNELTPVRGLLFLHSRLLNPDRMKDQQLCEVTRVAQGNVYFKAIYDDGSESASQHCRLAEFAALAKPANVGE